MNTPTPSGYSAIRPLLSRVGLDEKETEVYLALLSMKSAKASEISRAAKQSRSHTYLILRSLEEKGLVSEVERGKVIHFVAESPQRLLSFIQDRQQDLLSLEPLVKGVLPMLSGLTKPLSGSPRVTMSQGKKGMRQLLRDAFGQEICGIFNPTMMQQTFDGNIVTMILGKHSSLRGRDLMVDSPGVQKYLREVPVSDDYDVRILPKEAQFDTDTMIFGDTIALIAYDDQHTIVRIENKNIADAFRAWFEILWASSRLVS